MLKQVIAERARLWFGNRKVRLIGLLLMVLIIIVMAISILEFSTNENLRSLVDIFYWAVVTVMTVGYGDITPRTDAGRLLTVFVILIGVVLVSFLTATIASILTATRIREGRGLERIDTQDHIIICGFNRNIVGVIQSIRTAAGGSVPTVVLINDHPESVIAEVVDQFPGMPIRFVTGDYTLEGTLRRAAVTKAAAVLILAEAGREDSKPDERTLLATLAIKSLVETIRVCVELQDAANEVHLRRAGVDYIVFSSEYNGFLLANAVLSPGIPQAIRDLMQGGDGGGLMRRPMPGDLVGMSFRDAVVQFMDRHGMILVGVVTEKRSFNLESIMSGQGDAIDDFIRRKFEEAGRSIKLEARGRFAVHLNPGHDYVIGEDDHAVVIGPMPEHGS